MTGAEKKYGKNEWHELLLCPKCVCANPVGVTLMNDENDNWIAQLFCKKCAFYGHKDGSGIATVRFTPPWNSDTARKQVKKALENIDWSTYKPYHIIDG